MPDEDESHGPTLNASDSGMKMPSILAMLTCIGGVA